MALIDHTVMVRILAVNGVGPVMRVIAKDMLGLGRHVDAIGEKFGKWRIALAGIGVAVGSVGAAFIALDYRLLKAGDRIVQVQQRLAALGASQADIQMLSQSAYAGSRAAPAVSYSGAMGIARSMYGLFMNAPEASAATPQAVLASAVLQMANIPGGAEALANVLKSGEMSGALYTMTGGKREFSVERTKQWIDAATRGLEIPGGGLLTSASFRQAMMRAQPATYMIPPENLIPLMIEGVQQMRATFGRGLAYMYREVTGGPISRAQIGAMKQLGLLTPGGSAQFPGSSQGYIKPGGIRGYEELVTQGNPVGWVRDVLIPILEAHGDKTQTQQIADVERMYNVSGARVVADIIANLPAYERTYGALQREPHLQAQYEAGRQTLGMSMAEVSGSLETLMNVLGAPGVGSAAEMIHHLSAGIGELADVAKAHPDVANFVTKFGLQLGVLMVGLGTAAVMTAAISALGALASPVIGIVALAAGLVALGDALDLLPDWIKKAVKGPSSDPFKSAPLMMPQWFPNLLMPPGAVKPSDVGIVPSGHWAPAGRPDWYNLWMWQPKQWVSGVDPAVGRAWHEEGRPFSAAAPPTGQSQLGTPVPVVVVGMSPGAASTIAKGTTSHITKGLGQLPTGAINFHPNEHQTAPGAPTSQSILIR